MKTRGKKKDSSGGLAVDKAVPQKRFSAKVAVRDGRQIDILETLSALILRMQTFSPSFIPDLILLGLACGAFIIVAKSIFLFARLASRRPPLISPLLRHDTPGRSFHNANATLQEAMLARAVKEQQTVPPGWRSSQPRTLENALKPRPLAAINNPPSTAYKNPLKRTASQASGASQEVDRSKLSRSSSGPRPSLIHSSLDVAG